MTFKHPYDTYPKKAIHRGKFDVCTSSSLEELKCTYEHAYRQKCALLIKFLLRLHIALKNVSSSILILSSIK